MIRVVVVEDDDTLRAATAENLGLEKDVTVVGQAASGTLAVDTVAKLRPDVVVMDVRLPGFDGIEATRRLRTGRVEVRILLLTAFALEEYLMGGLIAGADGFLLKSSSIEDLADAVRAVAAGEPVVAQAMLKPLIWRAVRAYASTVSSRSVAVLGRLTPRERDVLQRICDGRRDLEIAQDLFISLATTKGHVRSILAKLEVPSRVAAAILGYHAGLGGHSTLSLWPPGPVAPSRPSTSASSGPDWLSRAE